MSPGKANRREDALDRIMRGASPEDCWTWTGAHTSEGYGHMSIRQAEFLAHRLVYELCAGPIAPGMVLDHLCRNPGCCNPTHLEQVTQRENILRGVGATAVNAAKTHCKYGHEFTPENTYVNSVNPTHRACRICLRRRHREFRERRHAPEVSG